MRGKKNILIAGILLVLVGCNFASSRYEYKVDCKRPDIFEFNLAGSFIRCQIEGYLEEDATMYIQSFSNGEDGGQWGIVELKSGKINHEEAFETYSPKGRIIYIPRGDRNIHYNSTKENLIVKIQTDHD